MTGSQELDKLVTAYSYDPTVVPQLIEEILLTRGHKVRKSKVMAMYNQVKRASNDLRV